MTGQTSSVAADQTLGTSSERRRNKRFRITRDGKIYRPEARQYLAAQTRDLSVGGALLEVDAERPFAPGDRVEIAVASTDSGVVRDDAMVSAIVVRAVALGGRRQTIAVRYTGPRQAARAA